MHLVLFLQNELITYYQQANRIHMQILYLKHFIFPKRPYADKKILLSSYQVCMTI